MQLSLFLRSFRLEGNNHPVENSQRMNSTRLLSNPKCIKQYVVTINNNSIYLNHFFDKTPVKNNRKDNRKRGITIFLNHLNCLRMT